MFFAAALLFGSIGVGFAGELPRECDMPNGANCWSSDTHSLNQIGHIKDDFGLPDPFIPAASDYAITAEAKGERKRGFRVTLYRFSKGNVDNPGEIWIRWYFYLPETYAANTGCRSGGLKFLDVRSNGGVALVKLSQNPTLRLHWRNGKRGDCGVFVDNVTPEWHYLEVHLQVNAGANDLFEIWYDSNAAENPVPTFSQIADHWNDDTTFHEVAFNKNWSGVRAPQDQRFYIKGAKVTTVGPIGDTLRNTDP